MVAEQKILRVKNRPVTGDRIELRSLADIEKLARIGNLICLYEGEEEDVYFIGEFIFHKRKESRGHQSE